MAKNVFNSVAVRPSPMNTFNLSHDVKYSTQMGMLTPVFLSECLPGDVFNLRTETLIRFAPLVAPVMHNISVYMHYFFVPNRILWDEWQDFISPDLSKDTPPAWPYIKVNASTPAYGLADYFGISTDVNLADLPAISAIPFAGYHCIWNEYYRDQNLQDEIDYKLVAGPNDQMTYDLFTVRRRAWMHDYFTSALPFAQKGPAVDLPIGTLEGFLDVTASTNTWLQPNSPASGTDLPMQFQSNVDGSRGQPAIDDSGTVRTLMPYGLQADASGIELGATTINDLRVAMRLQEFFEKAARGGSRYIEQIRVHFDTVVPDYRLDRPEFLGGTKNPVIISEVLQTSESSETPQANMAGHGISASSGKGIRYRCQEHGYIFGLISIMPNTAYQQGIPRHFSRQSWEDYAFPTFAHLGEQAILNKEIYVSDDGLNEDTFGYIPRYSEYRYIPSRVAGDFKDTLAFWHLGRIFENRPVLNAEFIECAPRNDIFAVTEENNQNLWCHSHNKVFVRRKLPKYGTPTL